MKPTKFDALKALAPNSKFVMDSDGVVTNHKLKNGDSLPTESAIDTKLASMVSDWEAQAYARARRPLYPNIGDQLDDLYHKGAFSAEMKAKIKKVKDDNPKPE